MAKHHEDSWIRHAAAGGVEAGATIVLRRSGIPEIVLAGGLQFSQFLIQDPETRQAWKRCQHEEVDFVPRLVEQMFRRFYIRASVPLNNVSDDVSPEPCLILKKRTPRVCTSPPITMEPLVLEKEKSSSPGRQEKIIEPAATTGEPRYQFSQDEPLLVTTDEPKVCKEVERRASILKLTRLKDKIRNSVTEHTFLDSRSRHAARRASRSSVSTDNSDSSSQTASPTLPLPSLVEMPPMVESGPEDEIKDSGSRSSSSSSSAALPEQPAREKKTAISAPSPARSCIKKGASSTSNRQTKTNTDGGSSVPRRATVAIRDDLRQERERSMTDTSSMRRMTDKSMDDPKRPWRRSVTDPFRRTRASTKSNFDDWLAGMDLARAQAKAKAEAKVNKPPNKVLCRTASLSKHRAGSKKIVRDLAVLKQLFNHYDEDLSGFIEFHEFLPLLSRLMQMPKSEMNMTEVWRNWDEVDADGSGQISLDEFQRWYCETFNIDANPDFTDFFNCEDLLDDDQLMIRDVARSLEMQETQIDKLFKEFQRLDVNGNKKLEFEEFKVMLMKQLVQSPSSSGQSPNQAQDVPQAVLSKFWNEINPEGNGGVKFPEFAKWYTKYLHNDTFSPMEYYYQTLGGGFRRAFSQRRTEVDQ